MSRLDSWKEAGRKVRPPLAAEPELGERIMRALALRRLGLIERVVAAVGDGA